MHYRGPSRRMQRRRDAPGVGGAVVKQCAVEEWDKKVLGKRLVRAQSLRGLWRRSTGLMRLKGELSESMNGKKFTLQPEVSLSSAILSGPSCGKSLQHYRASFGVGRILYCLLELSFWSRGQDAERVTYLKLLSDDALLTLHIPFSNFVPPGRRGLAVVLIVPLNARAECDPVVKEVCTSCSRDLTRSPEADGLLFSLALLVYSSVQLTPRSPRRCVPLRLGLVPDPAALRLSKAGIHARVDDSDTSIGKLNARRARSALGVTLDVVCAFIHAPISIRIY
ncbi:hypothetical protein C8R46DRAFT_1262168 [Mycena filopes]|nr:hypothetical protein C8R46DRAFT_1262168 [Mycena filopes]